MNRWKIAFYICIATPVATIAFSIYFYRSNAYTIMFQRTLFSDWKYDLENISIIINETDFPRQSIKEALSRHKLVNHIDFTQDTVRFETVDLIFKEDTLIKVIEK